MEAPAMKKCPACAEQILAEAIKCKHCGERLDQWPGAVLSNAAPAYARSADEDPRPPEEQPPRWRMKAAAAFWGVAFVGVGLLGDVAVFAGANRVKPAAHIATFFGMGLFLSLFSVIPAGALFAKLNPVVFRKAQSARLVVYGLFCAFYAIWFNMLFEWQLSLNPRTQFSKDPAFWLVVGFASCAAGMFASDRVARNT